LLKEVKDIMDEIQIITRIKEQQQIVMESFVKHIRRAIMPDLRSRKQLAPVSSWDLVLQGTSATDATLEDEKQRDGREKKRLTLARADHLLRDIQDRTFELNTLLDTARNTSAAVGCLLL
jgi:hypothetical protein